MQEASPPSPNSTHSLSSVCPLLHRKQRPPKTTVTEDPQVPSQILGATPLPCHPRRATSLLRPCCMERRAVSQQRQKRNLWEPIVQAWPTGILRCPRVILPIVLCPDSLTSDPGLANVKETGLGKCSLSKDLSTWRNSNILKNSHSDGSWVGLRVDWFLNLNQRLWPNRAQLWPASFWEKNYLSLLCFDKSLATSLTSSILFMSFKGFKTEARSILCSLYLK